MPTVTVNVDDDLKDRMEDYRSDFQ